MLELLRLALQTFVAAVRSRRDLALENLVLRHQLQVALRTNPHPRLRAPDRVLWVWLRQLWPEGRRQHLRVVQPATVLRWHRKGWRLYWRWKSRTRLGRPRLSAELKALIGRISQENRLWGTERIRGELLKLGIVVSNRSIRRYRWRRLRPGDHQPWRTFLANQLRGVWAADLFVVHTLGFRTPLRLLPDPPPAAGADPLQRHRQPHRSLDLAPALEATPWDRHPKYLIHDRDAVYGGDFHGKLASLGIAGVHTPPRAPKANSIAERIVRTIRIECLDHLIVIDERHLSAVLAEFADYYNQDRPHRSLRLQSPLPSSVRSHGRIASRPILGGLHHVYARAA